MGRKIMKLTLVLIVLLIPIAICSQIALTAWIISVVERLL